MDSVHISSLNAVIKQKNQVTANYNELLRQHETAVSIRSYYQFRIVRLSWFSSSYF